MIYVFIFILVILGIMTILYFIGKKVKKQEQVFEKMFDEKIAKAKLRKMKNHSRTTYAKTPTIKK